MPNPKVKPQKTNCIRCNTEMNFLGLVPFRIGGSDGAVMFFFSDFAELGERKADLYLFRCEKCHKVELFDIHDSLPDNDFTRL